VTRYKSGNRCTLICKQSIIDTMQGERRPMSVREIAEVSGCDRGAVMGFLWRNLDYGLVYVVEIPKKGGLRLYGLSEHLEGSLYERIPPYPGTVDRDI